MAAIGYGDVTAAPGSACWRPSTARKSRGCQRLEANVVRADEPVKADGMPHRRDGRLLVTLARCATDLWRRDLRLHHARQGSRSPPRGLRTC